MWKKVVGLGVILLAILMAGCTNEENVIKIGALLDLSGPLSTYGIDIKNNLELGKGDIENYFKKKNIPYKIEILTEDTKLDPNLALQKIQLLKGNKVNLFIGPMSSGEVKTVLPYTLSNKIIAVDEGDTAIILLESV